MSILFLCSTIALLALFTYALLIAIPPVRQAVNSTYLNEPFAIVFCVLIGLGIPSFLFMHLGMGLFCACGDSTTIGTKALWFLFFFLTGPLGSMVYYFSVYRRLVKKQDTGRLRTFS